MCSPASSRWQSARRSGPAAADAHVLGEVLRDSDRALEDALRVGELAADPQHVAEHAGWPERSRPGQCRLLFRGKASCSRLMSSSMPAAL